MPRARKSQGHVGIRRVRTKEDRKRPSVFMRLKTDEAFKGVALFEPDPELDDNPGYFEYYDHYDKQANQYVPCAGDRCPFCAANDNPSTRALTVWYFPQAADVKDRIKVFTMNYSTINEISDEAEDEDGLVGKVVRIKRLSDKGDYRVKVTSDKALTKAELKEAQKLLDEKFPEVEVDGETVSGLEALVLRQLKIQLERLKAVEALDDDDDDDEEEAPRSTSRKGKPAKAETTEAEDDDEDEEDEDEEEAEEEAEAPAAISDETFDILSVRKRDGYIVVEHDGEEVKLYASDDAGIDDFKKGDSVTASADWTEEDDEEGYWLLTEIAEAESDEDESDEEDDDSEDDSEEESDDDSDDDDSEDEEDDQESDEDEEEEITGGTFEVVRIQERDEILTLKGEDGNFKMWVGEGVNPEYDELKKGVQVTVDAAKDDEGDWIITDLSLAEAKKPRRRTAKR